jgi:hypothetical protein
MREIIVSLAGHLQNTARYCIMDTNFSAVKLHILANHVNPFYIESRPTSRIVAFDGRFKKFKKYSIGVPSVGPIER